jgi:hypothetical protein
METRFGVDHEYLLDDPMEPRYKKRDATAILQDRLGYEDEPCSGCPGSFEGTGAYFCCQALELEIPESIAHRIANKTTNEMSV